MSSFQELIDSETPTLVDFTAGWCGPCQTLAPILHDVANKIGEKAKIIKVDVDKNPAAAAHYGIQGVPTLILFKKGQMVWRQSGVMPASYIIEAIDQHAI